MQTINFWELSKLISHTLHDMCVLLTGDYSTLICDNFYVKFQHKASKPNSLSLKYFPAIFNNYSVKVSSVYVANSNYFYVYISNVIIYCIGIHAFYLCLVRKEGRLWRVEGMWWVRNFPAIRKIHVLIPHT